MDFFKDRKKLYIFGGVAAALLIIAIVLLLTLGGGKGKKYDKYYSSAEAAYLDRDYEKTVDYLEKALDVERTEEAYVLMAEAYCAMGDEEMAIQVLYLGYSRVGGATISDMLERLKAENGSVGTPETPEQDSDTVTIAGQEISLSATSLVMAGKGLTADDMKEIGKLTNLDSLSISSNSIRDLSPLSGLENLTFLQISSNNISDLSAIASLPMLKTLYMDDNPITDMTQLYSMTKLRTLSMKGVSISQEQLEQLTEALPDCSIYCDVTDISDVEAITIGGKTFYSDVTELELGDLGISDISELKKCTKLVKLDLRNNQISDISALKDMQNLEWLCLWNNKVEDILPLMTLKNLKYADFEDNNIKNISALEYMTGLKELWLNGNPVESIEPLKYVSGLTRLGLRNIGLDSDSLEVLYGMTELEELDIEGNRISSLAFDELKEALPECSVSQPEIITTVKLGDKEYDSAATELSAVACNLTEIAGLEQLTELKTLDLTGNSISNIEALEPLTKLESLSLYDNIVSDISSLEGKAALKTLNLQNNLISDISALSDCTALTKLSLSGNDISDVMPLSNCTALEELDLDGNDLTDITPLAALTGLKILNLENNSIENFSALYSLTQLETLNISGNNISEDELQHLQLMLPACFIIGADTLPADSSEDEGGDADTPPEWIPVP